MSHQGVIVPAAGVSFERTRELFGVSSSEANEAKQLADLAFRGVSRPVSISGTLVRRKSLARKKALTAPARRKKSLAAARRK